MQENSQNKTMCIDNTKFYVISKFIGAVRLQHLIKRLIKNEVGQVVK